MDRRSPCLLWLLPHATFQLFFPIFRRFATNQRQRMRCSTIVWPDQTIVCCHQTIVCSHQTIVCCRQTKKRRAKSNRKAGRNKKKSRRSYLRSSRGRVEKATYFFGRPTSAIITPTCPAALGTKRHRRPTRREARRQLIDRKGTRNR